MVKSGNPQKNVKERVWKSLTDGLDPENDPMGCIDDLKDNTSYAIDLAVFETATAILEDIEKADEPQNHAILVKLQKKWLVPVPDPEPPEIGTCTASDFTKGLPEISVPDWMWNTPRGKKIAKEAKEIVQSIEEHQMKKLQDEKRIRRWAHE